MKNRWIRNKRGNYIVEAAVVFPVIVLATITSVLIIMFFYSQMTERSSMHIALRAEAGTITQTTVYCGGSDWDGEIYSDRKAIGGEIYGKKYLLMSNKGILSNKGIFVVEGAWHATAGSDYVRYCNLVKGD